MESTNNKILTVSFMAAAILTGVVVFVILESLAAIGTGGFGRFVGQEFVRHGLPVAAGLLTFFLLQFNKRVVSWGDEVVTELRKIVWPSRKDTVAMTIMVCVMLAISGIILGLMDVISGSVIDTLLHSNIFGIFG